MSRDQEPNYLVLVLLWVLVFWVALGVVVWAVVKALT